MLFAPDEEDEDAGEGMGDSYISRESADEYGEGSVLSGDYEGEDHMMGSMLEEEDADDENEEEEDDDDEEVEGQHRDDHTQVVQPAEDAKKAGLKQIAVEDLSAELVTGISDLAVERDLKDTKS